MTDFNCEHVLKPDHCHPKVHCPERHDVEDCTGTISLKCHCPLLRTKTFVLALPPQTEAQLAAFETNTFNAWENAGFLVMAHSILDTGAGWGFAFTVGWYV